MLYSPALASRTLAKYTVPAAAPFAFAARSAVLGFHHSDSSRRRHHFRPQQVASRSHSTRATMTASTQLLQVRKPHELAKTPFTLTFPLSAASYLSYRSALENETQGILDANETYAAAFAQSDPALLKKLAQGQAPKIFWLGCSDSRVSAELSVVFALPTLPFLDVDTKGHPRQSDVVALTLKLYLQGDRCRTRVHLCARKVAAVWTLLGSPSR